jgi:hypothetical protein
MASGVIESSAEKIQSKSNYAEGNDNMQLLGFLQLPLPLKIDRIKCHSGTRSFTAVETCYSYIKRKLVRLAAIITEFLHISFRGFAPACEG